MTELAERIFARQFHAAEGANAWRVLPEAASAFFRPRRPAGNEIDIATSTAPEEAP